MMSLSILWTLLFIATVKARSDVSITEAALGTENTWNEVPSSRVAEAEENASKTEANNQNNEETILSRMGFDAFTYPIGSGKLNNRDGVNLGKAFDEKLQDVSLTLSRFSGIEPNELFDRNYNNFVNFKTGLTNSDELHNHQGGLRNGVLKVFNGRVDDVSVLGDPSRDGSLNVLNRKRQNLNRVGAFHSRSDRLRPYYNNRDSGYNNWNLNEKDRVSYANPNVENDPLLSRIAALNDAKELNKLNNLLYTNIEQNALHQRNHLLDTSKNFLGRRFIGRHGLSGSDVENVNVNVDDTPAVDELIGGRRSLVDLGKVNLNDQHFIVRKVNALNNLGSNLLDGKNSGIDSHLNNILANVRSGYNEINQFNKIHSLVDDSNALNTLDHLNRHGLRQTSLNNLNQANYALSNLESNALNTKAGTFDVNSDLASIIANVRASDNELNALNKIDNFNDGSNDVNVFDHLSKQGLSNNRNDLKRVSLNNLNEAKKLIGPLTFDNVVANRVSNELDGALLSALNAEKGFNALGALAVLNKAAAKANQNALLNNILSRSDTDGETNLLSKFAAAEDNPLDDVVNSLAVLSRIDSPDDLESSVNSEYSPEILSRSHKKSLNNLVDSKWDTDLDNENSVAGFDDVDGLLSRVSNRWNRKRLRNYGVPIRMKYYPKPYPRPYYPPKRYRPGRVITAPNYLYRPRLDDGTSENEYTFDKNGVSDVSSDLSEAHLNNLYALHANNNLNRAVYVDDEKPVRNSVSHLDNGLRAANSLLLAGSLSNLKEQRSNVLGRSNLRLLRGEENNKFDNLSAVPVRVGNGAFLNRAGGPEGASDSVDLNVVN